MTKYLSIIFVLLGIYSCRSVRYIPVESAKKDSVYSVDTERDSIYIRDSVYLVKGDTITEYKYKYIYRYKHIRDTLREFRCDTIRIPYQVEKNLSKWQKIKLDLGGIAMGGLIAMLLLIVYKVLRR